MTLYPRLFKRSLALTVAFSMVTASVPMTAAGGSPAGAPAPSPSKGRDVAASPTTPLERAMKDMGDQLDAASARMSYPLIRRLGLTGKLEPGEIENLEGKFAGFRRLFNNRLNEVLRQPLALGEEKSLQDEFYNKTIQYFNMVRAMEYIRALGNEPMDEYAWRATYGLVLPLNDVKNLSLVSDFAFFARNFTVLSKIQEDQAADVKASSVKQLETLMRAEFSRGKEGVALEIYPNPNLMQAIQEEHLTVVTSMENLRDYTLYFVARSLYVAARDINRLLRRPVEQVPDLDPAIANRFYGLRRLKQLMIDRAQSDAITAKKAAIYRPVLLKMSEAVWSRPENELLDEPTLIMLIGAKDATPEAIKNARDIEHQNIEQFIQTLLIFWPMEVANSHFEDLKEIVARARLYAVSTSLWGTAQLSLEQKQKLYEQLVAKNQAQSATWLAPAQESEFADTMARLWTINSADKLLRDARSKADKELVRQAQLVEEITTQRVQLKVLAASREAAIKELNPSDEAKTWLDKAVLNQGTYLQAYLGYERILFTLLQGFDLPQPVIQSMGDQPDYQKLAKFPGGILRWVRASTWNAKEAKLLFPTEVAKAFNDQPDQRANDVATWYKIGQLLKFDVAHLPAPAPASDSPPADGAAPASDEDPLLRDMGFAYNERQAYVAALSASFGTALPLLMHQMVVPGALTDSNEPLWKQLVAAPTEANDRIERALLDCELNNLKDLAAVRDQMAAPPASGFWQDLRRRVGLANNSAAFDGFNPDFLVIMTKSLSLGLHLKGLSGYSDLYDHFYGTVTEPTYLGRSGAEYIKLANSVQNYGMIFLLGQVVFQFAPVSKFSAAFHGFERILATVFGQRLWRLNAVILGALGITFGQDAYQGFYEQPHETDVLRSYQACGPAGCVTSSLDVAEQEAATQAQRSAFWNELKWIVGFAILQGGGMVLAGYGQRMAHKFNLRHLEIDIKRLHLETGDLNMNSVEAAERQALRQDPTDMEIRPEWSEKTKKLARFVHQTKVQQSARRLKNALRGEAAQWALIDEQFAPLLSELGLSPQGWKNVATLEAKALERQQMWKQGRLSGAAYSQQMETLATLKQRVKMRGAMAANDPLYRRILEGSHNFIDPQVLASTGRRPILIARIDCAAGAALAEPLVVVTDAELEAGMERLAASGKKDPQSLFDEMDRLYHRAHTGGHL